jgi:hypothetical protein
MAQRLATEYVKTCLQLSEAEMLKFMQLFDDHQVVLQVKVFENGNQEVVFQDEASRENIVLTFERKSGGYVSDYSCRLNQSKLADIMRKAVTSFKADAIVNRIYSNFTIVYYYARGIVVKIVEIKDHQQKVIYEYKNSVGKLEQIFLKCNVELEIKFIQSEIDNLLDQRIRSEEKEELHNIDQKLQALNHKLFVLEA